MAARLPSGTGSRGPAEANSGSSRLERIVRPGARAPPSRDAGRRVGKTALPWARWPTVPDWDVAATNDPGNQAS
jgi:hypothetical protein